jgi:hypothetical protein
MKAIHSRTPWIYRCEGLKATGRKRWEETVQPPPDRTLVAPEHALCNGYGAETVPVGEFRFHASLQRTGP